MFLRAPYNYSPDDVSIETGLQCKDPSLADQSQKDECDINTIVDRFGITGHLPESGVMPRYAVLEEVGDFQQYMGRQIAAEEAYNAMPSGLRRIVGSSYRDFLNFVDDPANHEKLVEFGLAVKRVDISDASAEKKPEA